MTGDQFINLAHHVEVGGCTYAIEAPGNAEALTRTGVERGDHNPAYWAHLWPIAHSFARFVAETQWITPDSRILEVGCGLGLVGLVAATRASHVVMTDVSTEAIAIAQRNAACNSITNISTARYDYNDPPDPSWRPDLILGSDLLYAPSAHQPIGALIRALNVPAILADPNRIPADNLEADFDAMGLSVWQTQIDGGRVFVVEGRSL